MKRILLTLSLSTCLVTYTHAGIMDTIKNYFSKPADNADQQADTEADETDFGATDQAEDTGEDNTDPQPSADAPSTPAPQAEVNKEAESATKAVDIPAANTDTKTETKAEGNTPASPDAAATSGQPAESTSVSNNTYNQSSFDIRTGFADVVEGALPAVVNVSTTQMMEKEEAPEMQQLPNGMPGGNQIEDLFRKFLEQNTRPRKVQSLGSGFIIKADAEHFYVVTNNHVVQDAKTIKLHFHDKTELLAQVHASDERTDIAVIKAKVSDLPENKRNLTVFQWSTSEKDRVGDWVIAIGNPFGFGSSVTIGIISGKGRDILSRASGS
ncbi:MAG: trypsin-like peptidase domain-containing protein, partial [Alphaproteobacteria bacterium]|nr:trypsin-like peptidase domain-containing protein [Alphaproteobacteria bacterium]